MKARTVTRKPKPLVLAGGTLRAEVRPDAYEKHARYGYPIIVTLPKSGLLVATEAAKLGRWLTRAEKHLRSLK